jgi:hypothetical protein
MGTRGVVGWRLDEEDKVAYNHFDSYPEELGVKVLDYAANTPLNVLIAHFNNVKLVKDSDVPTPEQIKRCHAHNAVNHSVSTQSDDDWYCLLSNVQGDLQATAHLGYMIDYSQFLRDSLFCEWAYIINLDTKKLEVYRGFQKNEIPLGRYGEISEESKNHQLASYRGGTEIYYGVGLLQEYDLADLPNAEGFVEELNSLDPHGA